MRQDRGRQARSARNDEAILDAALALAVDEGWAGLTPGRVAEVCGLARPTVLQRHADRVGVGAALWKHRCAAPFQEALAALMAVVQGQGVSPEALRERIEPFLHPSPEIAAALEFLIVAGYVPTLLNAVDETLGRSLTAWTSPEGGNEQRVASAQRAFLIGIALGTVLEVRRRGGVDVNPAVALRGIAQALSSPGKPTSLPAARADYLDQPAPFDTGDPIRNALLHAALECVGDMGYEAATLDIIASRAGYTKGAVFNRFPAKQDLFLDASNLMLELTGPMNFGYQVEIEQHHPAAIAEACMVREFTRPERRRMRVITSEQVRLASHDPKLQTWIRQAVSEFEERLTELFPGLDAETARGTIMIEFAFSTGLGVLAQLRPEIWRLPFDTVFDVWSTARRNPAEPASSR